MGKRAQAERRCRRKMQAGWLRTWDEAASAVLERAGPGHRLMTVPLWSGPETLRAQRCVDKGRLEELKMPRLSMWSSHGSQVQLRGQLPVVGDGSAGRRQWPVSLGCDN